MFGIDFGSIGRSLSSIAGGIPGFNNLASAALKAFDSLPIDELRKFAKEKFGVDLKDVLALTFPPGAAALDIRDAVAGMVENGRPERGSEEFSRMFNGARHGVREYYENR